MCVGLLMVVTPAVAASKASHKGSHVPSCAAISRRQMAKVAQTGHLTLRKKIGNLCEFTGQHPKHYEPMFEIQIIPFIQHIWNTAKSDAQSSAAKDGSDFGQINSHTFQVVGDFTDKGDPACTKEDGRPGKGESKFGPVCTPEPNAVHIGVYGHGKNKRSHLKLMVAAVVVGQQGDFHLSHMLALVQDVISGKIH